MHQNLVLVAGFVHVLWSMRTEPDIDSEILLLSPDVNDACAEAAEFYSLSFINN